MPTVGDEFLLEIGIGIHFLGQGVGIHILADGSDKLAAKCCL